MIRSIATPLLVVAVIAAPPSTLGEQIAATVESKGLLLGVSFDVPVTSWSEHKVTCRLTNESGSDVAFVCMSQMLVFSIELVTDRGVQVLPRPENVKYFIPDDRTSGRRLRIEIKPGESVSYQFCPVALFATDDPAGCRLRVRWGPLVGPMGRLPLDDKLVVEMTFPPSLPERKRKNRR